jgi:hypothetical protein
MNVTPDPSDRMSTYNRMSTYKGLSGNPIHKSRGRASFIKAVKSTGGNQRTNTAITNIANDIISLVNQKAITEDSYFNTEDALALLDSLDSIRTFGVHSASKKAINLASGTLLQASSGTVTGPGDYQIQVNQNKGSSGQ